MKWTTDDLPLGGPFNTYSWHGGFHGWEGCDDSPFTEDDVAEVIAVGESGDEWDGSCAALMRLHDGRFACYSTFYGPTGDGFCDDAYGGDAEVWLARTQDEAVRFCLGREGRRLLGIPDPEDA